MSTEATNDIPGSTPDIYTVGASSNWEVGEINHAENEDRTLPRTKRGGACDRCRTGKLRCDLSKGQESCARCTRLNYSCTFKPADFIDVIKDRAKAEGCTSVTTPDGALIVYPRGHQATTGIGGHSLPAPPGALHGSTTETPPINYPSLGGIEAMNRDPFNTGVPLDPTAGLGLEGVGSGELDTSLLSPGLSFHSPSAPHWSATSSSMGDVRSARSHWLQPPGTPYHGSKRRRGSNQSSRDHSPYALSAIGSDPSVSGTGEGQDRTLRTVATEIRTINGQLTVLLDQAFQDIKDPNKLFGLLKSMRGSVNQFTDLADGMSVSQGPTQSGWGSNAMPSPNVSVLSSTEHLEDPQMLALVQQVWGT